MSLKNTKPVEIQEDEVILKENELQEKNTETEHLNAGYKKIYAQLTELRLELVQVHGRNDDEKNHLIYFLFT